MEITNYSDIHKNYALYLKLCKKLNRESCAQFLSKFPNTTNAEYFWCYLTILLEEIYKNYDQSNKKEADELITKMNELAKKGRKI